MDFLDTAKMPPRIDGHYRNEAGMVLGDFNCLGVTLFVIIAHAACGTHTGTVNPIVRH
jgi:hypothetical protein